ncbi:MAG TPA: PD-(D/E)XK nuclease family protein, partial [Thermoanaerobaculia bacterium]
RLLGAATLGFDAVLAERARVEAAERVRTLYVAMTRAKDRLVLAGTWPEVAEAVPPERARTHLQLLGSRPERPDLPARWQEACAGAASWAFADAHGALWKFPALRSNADAAEVLREPAESALPSAEEVARASALLASRRVAARERMARPLGGAASEEAHALLREAQAARGAGDEVIGAERGEWTEDDAAPVHAADREAEREAAMAAGGALHRAIETWDLAADAAKEEVRQRDLLPAYLATLAEEPIAVRALPRARDLLARFAAGGLLARLLALRDHVVARELAVLLPPGESSHPLGYISGSIDLVYREPREPRDPKGGRLVVADYKTDDITGDAELAARAKVYAPQGEVYTRALREALGLSRTPRFELWFVRAGKVIALPE